METRPEPFSWWVAFRNPAENYRNHPTYLVPDVIFHVIAALLLVHALRRGGRYPWLYFSALSHGVFTEVFSYWVPQINNFWHGQSTVMFAGQRLPSYIVCQYIAVIYTSSVAAARLRLGVFAGACATALVDSLYYHVFDVTGVKMLWWAWHDTDPNVYDRTYWVPWGSPYWRLSFASSFTLLFHGVHRLLGGQGMFQRSSLFAELGSAAVAVFLTFPVGVATQFVPLFHVVKDVLGVHAEVPVLMLICIFVLIVWGADRSRPAEARTNTARPGWFDEIAVSVLLNFLTMWVVVAMATPEHARSIGLHQPTGPCNETEDMYLATGQVVQKGRYLCVTDYDEGYFDWHCLPGGQPPPHGMDWYTMCGTPYANRAEYLVVVGAIATCGIAVYYNLLAMSAGDYESGKNKPKTH
ncbi:uncharacterized protein LOC144861065 [Branchiostoma floridae x Branchiostoma japonicum]